MRIAALILAVAAATLLLTPASAQEPSKPETPPSADKVKELQKERIAALKTVAVIETALRQKGMSSPEDGVEARVLVCEAELDAAEKEADRISILKNLVEALKELEDVAKARKQRAEGTESAVLKAKARRLEAEIRLERALAPAQGEAKPAELKREKVVVASLQAKEVVIKNQFAGQIDSQRRIDVRSHQSGYLEEVYVKEGQAVKQGEVLFQVARLIYKAKLDTELAEVEQAALNLKNTERLFQSKVVSAEEVAILKAKLAGAQAKAKVAQAELGLTTVRAAFDGVVGRVLKQPGSLVTERDTLTTLSNNSVIGVYFHVPQARYLQFMANPAKDQAGVAELMLADGRKFSQPGKIAAIDGQFDKETGTIPFRADFPNPEGLLRHGMSGNVLISETLSKAIVIPQRATFETLGKRYVYVVDKEDVAHRREIDIRSTLQDDFVVEKGLAASDRIVVEGVRQIHDGEKLEYELRRP